MEYLRSTADRTPIMDAVLEAAGKHILAFQKRQAELIAASVAKLFK